MSDFTTSTGATITHRPDTGSVLVNFPDKYVPQHISAESQRALREYFRHEEDERLGRCRWPENPDYVVYGFEPGSLMIRVVNENDGTARNYYRDEMQLRSPEKESRRAARAYFEAHPTPKEREWASATVITWRDGAYLPQIAQRDPQTDGEPHDMGWYTWLGHDGRWLTEDDLAQLIGDADVTVLTPEATS